MIIAVTRNQLFRKKCSKKIRSHFECMKCWTRLLSLSALMYSWNSSTIWVWLKSSSYCNRLKKLLQPWRVTRVRLMKDVKWRETMVFCSFACTFQARFQEQFYRIDSITIYDSCRLYQQSIFSIALHCVPHKPLDWYKYINLAHKYCRWEQHSVAITRSLSAPKH